MFKILRKPLICVVFLLIPYILPAQSWTSKFGPLGEDVEGMYYRSGLLLIGTDTGVFSSSDLGETWINDTTGLETEDIFSFSFAPNGVLLTGTELAGVFASSDLGQHWRESSSGMAPGLTIPSMVTADSLVFALDPNGGLFRSADNGLTWTKQVSGIPHASGWSMLRAPNGNLFLGFTGYISRSTDDGTTWETIELSDASDEVLALGADSSGTLFAGTFHGQIMASYDHGVAWTPINAGLRPVRTLASFRGRLFAGLFGGGVIAGTVTQQGQWTWTPMLDGLEGDNLKVLSAAVTENGMLFIGTLAAQVFRIDLSKSSVNGAAMSQATKLSFIDDALIVSSSKNTEAKITLYDIAGRRIAQVFNGELTGGEHRFSLGVVKVPCFVVLNSIDGSVISSLFIGS